MYKEKKFVKNLIKDEKVMQRNNVSISKYLYIKETISIKLKRKTNLLRNCKNVIRHTEIVIEKFGDSNELF